jgi:hypothetical protein
MDRFRRAVLLFIAPLVVVVIFAGQSQAFSW